MPPFLRPRPTALPIDLKIGALESDNAALQHQVDELKSQAITDKRRYDDEVARAVKLQSSVEKHQADATRQALQITNLQQALDKAQQHASQDARGRRLEDQQRSRALDWQSREDGEEKKRLEEQLRSSEMRLRERDEEIRVLQQQQSSGSGTSRRGVDPVAKALALENENTTLRSRISSLESSLEKTSSSLRSFDPLATPIAANKQRGNARRPRSSSISGSTSAAQSFDPSRLQGQLQELQTVLDETRSECTKLEARAQKAEREALKATNEAMANQKQGERVAAELRNQVRELKEDLKWRSADCDALTSEIQELEKRLEAAETSSTAEQQMEDAQARLRQAEACVADGQRELQSLQAQLQQAESSSSTARRELQVVTSQRDALNDEVRNLEDQVERLQQAIDSPATTSRSSRTSVGGDDAGEDGDETVRDDDTAETRGLSDKCRMLSGMVEHLQRSLDSTETSLESTTSERDTLITEVEALRAAVRTANEAQDVSSSASSTNDEDDHAEQLQRLQLHVDRLRDELAEKDAAVEQAEALAEEDTRQLRMRNAEVKQMSAEVVRLRQKAKESILEIDVLRASVMGSGGDAAGVVEARLAELRKELDARDEQLLVLRKTIKGLEDEREAGKKQLKRLATYMTASTSATPSSSSNAATPSTPNGKKTAPATTPLSKLLRSNHYFSTPGGRPLQRAFDEDLLDQIELVREALQEADQQREFLRIEGESSKRSLQGELQRKVEALEEMETRIQGLQQQLDAANAKLAEISEGEQTHSTAREQQREQMDELTREKTRLEDEVTSLQAQLTSAQDELQFSRRRQTESDETHASDIAVLEGKLQQSTSKVQAMALLSERLDTKRQELARVVQCRHAVQFTEHTAANDETVLADLEGKVQSHTDDQRTWQGTATEADRLLRDCRDRIASAPAQSKSSGKGRSSLSSSEEISRLRAKVQELKGRVLRREEQIGAQQIKIEKLTTRLAVSEEDGEDLLEEKQEIQAQLEAARSRLDEVEKSHAASLEALRLEVAQLNEALQVSKQSLEAEQAKITQLETKAQGPGSEDSTDADSEPELASMALQLSEQQAKVSALVEELDAQRSEVEELNEILDSREVEVERLQRECKEAAEAKKDATANLADVESERDHLQAEVERLRSQEEELVSAKSNLQGQVDELLAGLKSEKDDDDLARHLAAVSESDARSAQLESELDNARSAHRDELIQRENELESLRKQLSSSADEITWITQSKADVLTALSKAEAALESARDEVKPLQERVHELEAEKAARESQMAALQEQADDKSSADLLESKTAIEQLQEEIAGLQSAATQADVEHKQALKQLQAQLSDAEEARSAAEDNATRLSTAQDENEKLQLAVQELESSKATLERKCAEIESRASQSEDEARAKLQEVQASLSELSARLESMQAELDDRAAALQGAEAAIAERDAHIKTRNEEYWAMKEEVAELQEAQERSRLVGQSVADLQAQLQEAQEESDRTEAAHRAELQRVRKEAEGSSAHMQELEREMATQQSRLADLEGEIKRRKAAHKSTEEDLEQARGQAHAAETSLQSCQTALARVEAQLQTSREEITRLQKDAEKQGDNGGSAQPAGELQEELAFLTSRVKELEDELTVKAEEVEEADTKILAGLKDSKKLSAKVKSLQKQIEGLQAELVKQTEATAKAKEAAQSPAAAAQRSVSSSASPAIQASSTAASSPATSTPSSASSSRKRSAPDEDSHPTVSGSLGGMTPSHSGNSLSLVTRAVYVDAQPSPAVERHTSRPISPARERGSRQAGAGGFMPTRKEGPSAAVSRRPPPQLASAPREKTAVPPTSVTSANTLQDRTNIQAEVTAAPPVVSKETKPVVVAAAAATRKVASGANGAAPVKPSEKTAPSARTAAPTSSLMKALAAKRKMQA